MRPTEPAKSTSPEKRAAVGVVGEVSRRVAGDRAGRRTRSRDLERLAACEKQPPACAARSVTSGRREPPAGSRGASALPRACARRACPLGEVGDTERGGPSARASRGSPAQRAPSRASVSRSSVASPLGSTTTASLAPALGPDDVAVRPDRSERELFDAERHRVRPSAPAPSVGLLAAQRGAGPCDRRSDRGSS